MASDTEITKVRIVIRHLLWQIREVRKDRDAAWKWVNRFANTLQYQELEQDPDQYALAILAEARSFNDQQRRKGQMLGVRKQLAKEGVTSPTQEQLDEKWLEMYGNETTADASEGDGEVNPDGQQATQAEAGTSANLYGEAATREGADVSTTFSNPMRRVPQNEAPAHGFSGGRTAQGTMSRSPEAAAQSGKVYDQEAAPTSTNGPRQAEAPRSQRAGGNSLRVAKVSTPPARSSGPMPEGKQEVYDFAAAEGLDTADAYECWHVTVNERDGLTADGKPVKNWKAYVRKWCETRGNRRKK